MEDVQRVRVVGPLEPYAAGFAAELTWLGYTSGQRPRGQRPHQLPQHSPPLAGLGVRDGKAMIATLRHRLLCIPGRLIHHAGQLILRLPPGHQLLPTVLTRLRALPHLS